MASELIDCSLLDGLIDELDIKAQDQHVGERSEEYWVCQRRYPRHPFRVVCKVRFPMPGSTTVTELPGRTRNLSRNGLGLLVRRVFTAGEVVEVEVLPPGHDPMYMAGVIRFCRYAGRGFHEVGIQLRAAGPRPIMSKHAGIAAGILSWLRGEDDAEPHFRSS